MSTKKETEYHIFSNLVMSRNIVLDSKKRDSVAIYFAFEGLNNPKLTNKYEDSYKEGELFVKNLINDLS